jgi:hypothetical protein
MVRTILFEALFFGFWVPPLMVGRWIAGRRQRVFNIPLTAVGWSLIWLVTMILLIPPCVRKGPSDPCDGPAYMVVGCFGLALYLVLPGSALACWLGTRRRRLQDYMGERTKLGISLVIFALIQALFIAFLLFR